MEDNPKRGCSFILCLHRSRKQSKIENPICVRNVNVAHKAMKAAHKKMKAAHKIQKPAHKTRKTAHNRLVYSHKIVFVGFH
jgi:hypothetical protein